MKGVGRLELKTAFERASHVVLCVSPGFKRSALCRMHARFAHQYAKRDRLQLLYCMMHSWFTPQHQHIHQEQGQGQGQNMNRDRDGDRDTERDNGDEGEGLDGWLGFMVGDAPWYALWRRSCIPIAAGAIIAVLGPKSRVAGPAASAAACGGGGGGVKFGGVDEADVAEETVFRASRDHGDQVERTVELGALAEAKPWAAAGTSAGVDAGRSGKAGCTSNNQQDEIVSTSVAVAEDKTEGRCSNSSSYRGEK